MATTEEANLDVGGHRTLIDESIIDQNVEVISNQQASFKEITQSIGKGTEDAQKDEEGETKLHKSSYMETSKQVISISEADVGQHDKDSVSDSVLTVKNLNKVETLTDRCVRAETINRSSTTDTILVQEKPGETKFKVVDNKEAEDYSTASAEEKGSEAISPSEEIGNKDKEDNIRDSIEDASFPRAAESPETKNEEEAALDIGDGAADQLEGSSAPIGKYMASSQEDGSKLEEMTKEASSTECKEKNKDTNDLKRQEKYVTPIEDDAQNNNNSDAPFITEETCVQKVDDYDISKLDPKISVENFVMDSTKEVINKTDSYEEIPQAYGSASEGSKGVENYDKKANAPSTASEEGMQRKGEDLDRAEASAGGNRDKEGLTAVVTEDNIRRTELTEGIEQRKLASMEHGGGPELSLLQQSETEKEKPERPLNVISEEIETAVSTENFEFENPDDSSKEKGKDDQPTATYNINEPEIPEQKNLSLIHLNEKTESAEAETPNNDPSIPHFRHSVVEETQQVEGKRTDAVSDFELEEKIQRPDGISEHEKRQVASASEADQSTERTISEHTSTEGAVRVEMIAKTTDIKELETVYGLDSRDKLEVKLAEANIPEVTNSEEATEMEIHTITTESNSIEEGLPEDDTTKAHSTVNTGDEAAKIQEESHKETASKFSGEDERNNVAKEEAHDGHKTQARGDVDKEKIEAANVTCLTPKLSEELQTAMTSESLTDEKMHEVQSPGNSDNNRIAEATEISAKVTPQYQEDSEQGLQINELGESIAVESPENAFHTSLVKQKEGLQGECEDLESTEASTESRDQEISSINLAEDNDEHNRPAGSTENNVKAIPEAEEDSDHVLKNNKPGERNHEVESPAEIPDTIKQGEGLQEDTENQALPEASTVNKDVETTSAKGGEYKTENPSLAEVTENSAKAAPEVEEISVHASPKDEPGEGIAGETNCGAGSPEDCPDSPSMKQDEGLQGQCKNPAPIEAAKEKRDEDTSCLEEAEDNKNIERAAETTENSTKVTQEGGEDSEKVPQIDEPGQNIVGLTNHNVESPEKNLDILLVKQEGGIEGDDNNLAPTTTDEDTLPVKVAENNDNNNRQVEAMENAVMVTPQGEEDSEQLFQKDDPEENPEKGRNHEDERPEEILDNSLENQEEDPQGKGEDTSPAVVAEHKEDSAGRDGTEENNAKATAKGEEDTEDAAREGIAREADHEIESPQKNLNTPLVKEDEDLHGEDGSLIPVEEKIDKRDEIICPVEIAEGNDDNNRLAEPAEKSAKVIVKGQEDLEQAQKEEGMEADPQGKGEDTSPAVVAEHQEDSAGRDGLEENNAKATAKGEEDTEDAAGEGIAREADHEIESPEKNLNTPLVKEDEDLHGEDGSLIPVEEKIDKRDEIICPIEIAEGNDDYNRLAEPAEKSAKVTVEGQEDLEQAQKEEGMEADPQGKGEDTSPAVVAEHQEDSAGRDGTEENNAKATAKGEEDTEDAAGEGIACEADHEIESPQKNLNTPLVKEDEDLHGEDGSLIPVEEKMDKRDEIICPVEIAEGNDDNNRLAEPAEKSAKVTVKGQEDLEQAQKEEGMEADPQGKGEDTSPAVVAEHKEDSAGRDGSEENNAKETAKGEEDTEDAAGEGIACEADHEIESPEKNLNTPLVKEDEDLHGEDGSLIPVEEKMDKRDEILCPIEMAEGNDDNNRLAEPAEKSAKVTVEGQEDLVQAQKEEGMEADPQGKGEDTSPAVVAEHKEDSAGRDGSEENNAKETAKGEEDTEDAAGEGIAREADHEIESPEKNLNTPLVKEDEDLHGEDGSLIPVEEKMDKRDEILCPIEMAEGNDDNNRLAEPAEKSAKVTVEGQEDLVQAQKEEGMEADPQGKGEDTSPAVVAEHKEDSAGRDGSEENNAKETAKGEEDTEDAAGEGIAREADHEIESPEKNLNTPLVKEDEDLHGEDGSLIPVEEKMDKRDEILCPIEIAEGNDDNNRLAEPAEKSAKVTVEGQEDLVQAQKEEGMEEESSSEKTNNTTSVKEEKSFQNIEDTSETEKREETKTVDDKREKEAAVGKENKEETLRHEENINSDSDMASTSFSEEADLKEAEPENNVPVKSSDNKENSKEDQECKGLETAASSSNPEKLNLEKPATEDLSSSIGEVTAKESLKEDKSDGTKIKEEVKDTNMECTQQVETIDLTEETESRILQDSVNTNKDFNALITADVPKASEEEITEENLRQEEEIINDSESATITFVSEEGLKEAGPEKTEKVKDTNNKENSKEPEGSETAASSANPNKLNLEKPSNEDLSSSIGEVTESLKEDESDSMKSKEEIRDTNLKFIQKVETIDLTEEMKSRTLKDYVEPNQDFSALTTANVSELSEEEIKEETLRQEVDVINDPNSASLTFVSEEGLKETEPENYEQVKSPDNKENSNEDQELEALEKVASGANPEKQNLKKPANEGLSSSTGEVIATEGLKEDESDTIKSKSEVKGTNLNFKEQVETRDLTEEMRSRTLEYYAEPKKDFSALTVGNEPEVSEEKIKEETLRQEQNIINDSESASITFVNEAAVKEVEPENNEQVKNSNNKENSEEDQESKGLETVASSPNPEKQNLEEPAHEVLTSLIGEVTAKESLKEDGSDATKIKEEVKCTNLESIEQIEGIDLIEKTSSGTPQDCSEPNKDLSAFTIVNVPAISEEKIEEEAMMQEDTMTHDSHSASATVVNEDADLKEGEPEKNKQVQNSDNKENSKEDQDPKGLETVDSSGNPEKSNQGKPANEYISSSIGELTAENSLKEDENDPTELKAEVQSTNLEFIEQTEAKILTDHTKSETLQDCAESGKGLTTIETSGTSLESVNIDGKPEENSNSKNNKNKDMLASADEDGEQLKHPMEDKVSTAVIDNEIQLTTSETPSDRISEDGSRDSYQMPLKGHQPMTMAASQIVEETPIIDDITHENVRSLSSVQKTDEKSTQKGDESINPKDLTESLSSDDCMKGATEEIQKHKDTEDVDLSKKGETGDFTDQNEACKLKLLKDENPSHEAPRSVAISTYRDSENAIQEQEDSVQSFGSSSTGVVLEKTTADLEASTGSHKCEPTNSTDSNLLIEKNLTPADLDQKLDAVSTSVTKDQSDETFPQTSKTEENSNDVQNLNSESVEQQTIGEVQHDTERKLEMQAQLEAKDHSDVSQHAKVTGTSVIAGEEVHEGVEKAGGSGSSKEQDEHGQSDLKEIHTVHAGDEILEKVKDSGPKFTEYLKPTDSSEQTLNADTKEVPTSEAGTPGTKAPEEEKTQDEGSLKRTDVSVAEAEDSEEKIKEETKVEVGDFQEKNDNATAAAVESTLEEAQMDDKPVKGTSSAETSEKIETGPRSQAEEIGSKEPEKTSSSLVSQLPNMDQKCVEKDCVTPEKPDADEVEETKTVSTAVFTSKYHGVEETDETGQGLRVEKLEVDGNEERINEASVTASDSKYLRIEAVSEDEITVDQTLPPGKLEVFQTPSSEMLYLEQKHGPKEREAIKIREGEMLDDKKIYNSCSTIATEETCLQKEEQQQGLSSMLLPREQEHESTTAFKKTEGESTKEVEMVNEKNINNSSATKATEETCFEEGPRELEVSQLGIEIQKDIQMDSSNSVSKEECCTSDVAEKVETEENEETKYSSASSESKKTVVLTTPIEEPLNPSFEISEKAFDHLLDVHSHEVLISSEEKVHDECIMKLVDDSTTVAEESFKNTKEEITVEVDNGFDKTENAAEELVTAESSSWEAQLQDMSTKDTISHERSLETIVIESSPLAEEVLSMTHEKTSSTLPSQLQNTINGNTEKETLENPDAHEVEETKTTSDAIFESTHQSVKETDETEQSLKAEKLDATDVKEIKETSESSSKPEAAGVEVVGKGGGIADQTLQAGMSTEQLPILSSSIPSRGQDQGTMTTEERTQKQNMKEIETPGYENIDDSSVDRTIEGTCLKKKEVRELEVPKDGCESAKAIERNDSDEVQKEESNTMDQALKLEPREREKIKDKDSPSESGVTTELTRANEEASNLNFEINEKASDPEPEGQSHEVLTNSEDISEKHLQAEIAGLSTEESQCKETVEADQISKNEVPIEGVLEEKIVSKDSKSALPGEEKVVNSHEGVESKTEEYPTDETNKILKGTTNVDQEEAFRLSEIVEESSASERSEKKFTAKDRTVENDNASESYPAEAEEKNVEEAAIKLEPENQEGETNLIMGKTEVVTPGEKEVDVEISPEGGTTRSSKANEITQNTQQLGMTSYAASKEKISEDADPCEKRQTILPFGHEDVPPVPQHPTDVALQKVEAEYERPGKATEIDAEEREVVRQGEKRMGDSVETITEESISVESAKFSLSDLMQRSMKENWQATKDLIKDREQNPCKADMQDKDAETTQFSEPKTDEEEGDEHKRTDLGSEAPVMVEVSKDIDVKIAHKKSHNILSGVGSKVKHSISKVKKAITGKSSHPKTPSPK